MFAWLKRSVSSMVTSVVQPQAECAQQWQHCVCSIRKCVGRIEVGVHAFDESVQYEGGEGASLSARKEVDENAPRLAHRKRLLASGRARATVRLAASCPRPEPIAVMPETHKPR